MWNLRADQRYEVVIHSIARSGGQPLPSRKRRMWKVFRSERGLEKNIFLRWGGQDRRGKKALPLISVKRLALIVDT